MEHFGRNDHVFTTGEIPQCATDDLFAAAIGIAIGGIKEIYAAFQRTFNNGTAALFRQCPCVITAIWLAKGHTAEAKSGNAKVGFS